MADQDPTPKTLYGLLTFDVLGSCEQITALVAGCDAMLRSLTVVLPDTTETVALPRLLSMIEDQSLAIAEAYRALDARLSECCLTPRQKDLTHA